MSTVIESAEKLFQETVKSPVPLDGLLTRFVAPIAETETSVIQNKERVAEFVVAHIPVFQEKFPGQTNLSLFLNDLAFTRIRGENPGVRTRRTIVEIFETAFDYAYPYERNRPIIAANFLDQEYDLLMGIKRLGSKVDEQVLSKAVAIREATDCLNIMGAYYGMGESLSINDEGMSANKKAQDLIALMQFIPQAPELLSIEEIVQRAREGSSLDESDDKRLAKEIEEFAPQFLGTKPADTPLLAKDQFSIFMNELAVKLRSSRRLLAVECMASAYDYASPYEINRFVIAQNVQREMLGLLESGDFPIDYPGTKANLMRDTLNTIMVLGKVFNQTALIAVPGL
jgi:hypothetical protein